jgi:hypothetical protein
MIINFFIANAEAIRNVVGIGVTVAVIIFCFVQSSKKKTDNKAEDNTNAKELQEEQAKREHRRKINFTYDIILSIIFVVLQRIYKNIGTVNPDFEKSIVSIKQFPFDIDDHGFTIFRYSVLLNSNFDADIMSVDLLKIKIQGELERGLKAGEFMIGKHKSVVPVGDYILPCLIVDKVHKRDDYIDIDIVIPNEEYVRWAAYRDSMNIDDKSEQVDDYDDLFTGGD